MTRPMARRETAKSHEVEALADRPKKEHCDGNGDGDDEPGNERRGPVAKEEKEDDAGKDQAYRMALRTLVMLSRTMVDWSSKEASMTPAGKRFAELVDLRGHCVGDGIACCWTAGAQC